MESQLDSNLTRDEIITRAKSISDYVSDEFSVDFIYLGGSWAFGTNNWWSDIDIFVSIPHFLNLLAKEKLKILLKLSLKFEEKFESEKVQISVFESLPLHVQFSVIKDGILIYESSEIDRLSFIEHLLNRYYDNNIWYINMVNESLGLKNHGD